MRIRLSSTGFAVVSTRATADNWNVRKKLISSNFLPGRQNFLSVLMFVIFARSFAVRSFSRTRLTGGLSRRQERREKAKKKKHQRERVCGAHAVSVWPLSFDYFVRVYYVWLGQVRPFVGDFETICVINYYDTRRRYRVSHARVCTVAMCLSGSNPRQSITRALVLSMPDGINLKKI